MLTTASVLSAADSYDVIIRNGMIYDGSGNKPFAGDVAVNAQRIAAVGNVPKDARAKLEVDAKGLAVSPGFINMLSWANESLIQDGRSQGEIRQGVTLEVMGEGESMGPYNAEMKRLMLEHAFRFVENVVFLIGADNLRSRRAVEKIGKEGT